MEREQKKAKGRIIDFLILIFWLYGKKNSLTYQIYISLAYLIFIHNILNPYTQKPYHFYNELSFSYDLLDLMFTFIFKIQNNISHYTFILKIWSKSAFQLS